MNDFDIPILIICFNRPERTKYVFNSVRQANPKKIYVSFDGPRNENDIKLIKQNEDLLNRIDWGKCEVNILKNRINKGAQIAVFEAINWLFENEEYGIILEDDIMPYQEFYYYCKVLLEKYKDDKHIASISGWSYFYKKLPDNYKYTYYFSHIQSSWGWATWKDRWENMDITLQNTDFNVIEENLRKDNIDEHIIAYYKNIFYNHDILKTTWDYQFLFSCLMAQNKYCIQPIKRFVENIGYGTDCAHPSSINPNVVDRIETNFNFSHPEKFEYISELDNERNKQTGEIC